MKSFLYAYFKTPGYPGIGIIFQPNCVRIMLLVIDFLIIFRKDGRKCN